MVYNIREPTITLTIKQIASMCNREVLQSEDQLERPEKKRHPEPTYFCVQLTPSRVHFFILFLA